MLQIIQPTILGSIVFNLKQLVEKKYKQMEWERKLSHDALDESVMLFYINVCFTFLL